MTIHQKRFNTSLALWLKKYLKGEVNIFQIMLKANELWANANGHYPEKDEDWVADLCLELLKVIEDIAWEQLPTDSEESKNLLWFMYVSELSANRIND